MGEWSARKIFHKQHITLSLLNKVTEQKIIDFEGCWDYSYYCSTGLNSLKVKKCSRNAELHPYDKAVEKVSNMYFELTVQAKDYWLPKYQRRFNQHRQDQFSTNIFSTKAKNLKNLPCSQDVYTVLNSQDVSELTPSPQLPLLVFSSATPASAQPGHTLGHCCWSWRCWMWLPGRGLNSYIIRVLSMLWLSHKENALDTGSKGEPAGYTGLNTGSAQLWCRGEWEAAARTMPRTKLRELQHPGLLVPLMSMCVEHSTASVSWTRSAPEHT